MKLMARSDFCAKCYVSDLFPFALKGERVAIVHGEGCKSYCWLGWKDLERMNPWLRNGQGFSCSIPLYYRNTKLRKRHAETEGNRVSTSARKAIGALVLPDYAEIGKILFYIGHNMRVFS